MSNVSFNPRQKKEWWKYAGTGKIPETRAEEVIYSASEMLALEHANQRRLGCLADITEYSIPYPQIKKIAALKNFPKFLDTKVKIRYSLIKKWVFT